MRLRTVWAGITLACGMIAGAQQPAAKADVTQAATAPVDAEVSAAASYIGRAVFLHCLCADNTLSFDADGRMLGKGKITDWTLAGFNVKSVERKGPGAVELVGVRTAIRYNTDNHEFVRHPMADETMRVTIADTGNKQRFERALEAAFAVGIDPALQHATPPFWQHYFNPQMPWPPDGLAPEEIFSTQTAASAPVVTAPVVTHREDPSYTAFARRDKVSGTVQMRVVVGADGTVRRINIVQPLGYGLDERAVEAVSKFRFTPGMREGKAVAVTALVNQEFTVVAVPR